MKMKQCKYYNKSFLRHIHKISFSSWTYDRLLLNALVEKKDLSLLGFIVGLLSITSILCSFILMISIDLYHKLSRSKKTVIKSSSIDSTSTTTSES